MKEKYTIDEILNAMNDLQDLKTNQIIERKITKKNFLSNKVGIPADTLKLIQEAEETKSKTQSE